VDFIDIQQMMMILLLFLETKISKMTLEGCSQIARGCQHVGMLGS
jgi:hypothetical protein